MPEPRARMRIDAARLLVVTSPPLRDAVAQRLRARFPEAALLVWTHGDRAGRAAVRNAVLAGDWVTSHERLGRNRP